MSQTNDTAEPSTNQPPTQHQFDSASGKAASEQAWYAVRRKRLKEHDLWTTYKHVPPKSERDKPIDAYLPGGSEYE